MPMFFVGNKPKTQFNLPKQQPIERKQINTPRNSGFHVTSPHPPFDISELKKQGKEVHLRKIHHHNVPHQHNHNNIYYDNKGLIPHPFVYDDYEDFARIGTASTTIEYTYEKPFNHEVIKPTQHEPVFMNQTEKCDCHGKIQIFTYTYDEYEMSFIKYVVQENIVLVMLVKYLSMF